MKKLLLILVVLSISKVYIVAQPALPEKDFRWVLNEQLSDEFNGAAFDLNKWKNTDASKWIGRAPGLFMENAATQANGNLCLTTDIFTTPQVVNGTTFTHQGAHIISKNKIKPGSFVECKMKANKTFMSSTFWLINYTNETTDCQKRTTELDIQECIGYPTTKVQTQQMGSNTHSRNVPTTCTQILSGSVGNNTQLTEKVYDRYFTYGVWWKSKREILFYLDGVYQYTITPVADFDIDMYIKMVCETYDWNTVPTDGGMTGSWEDRTTYYDWVRTYTYLPIDEVSTSSNNIFTEEISLSNTPDTFSATDLSIPLNYKANSDKKIVVEIKNSNGIVVATTQQIVLTGFGNLTFKLDSPLNSGMYLLAASMLNATTGELINKSEKQIQITNTSEITIENDSTFKLYPNPTKEFISIGGVQISTMYDIISSNGKTVLSGVVDKTNSKINISSLSPAIYIVKIKDKEKPTLLNFIKH